jgi:hypothetical protein
MDTLTASPSDRPTIDYAARDAARMAWIKAHLVRADAGQPSEVSIDTDWFRFRVYRANGGWRLTTHKARDSRHAVADMFPYEFTGDSDHEIRRTRDAVLSWIALHWGDVIDRNMAVTR